MMLRRLALAALLALAPSLASAQFATIGPTPATSDNGDRLATTAWVNAFAAGSLPLQSGKIFIGSAGNVAVGQTPSGDCTLSLSGVITCTQAAGNFLVVGNLSVGGSIIDGNGILATNIVAPATPAAGTTRIYVDSTTKTLSAKNDAGTVSNTVVASLAVANQFMTGISAAGVITRAQPNFTDLAGQGTCAQEPAMTGDVTSSAGSCALAIGANKVTRAMEAQGVARSVIGVTGNATANVADIQGTASQFLGINSGGTALAFQTMSGDCTLAGAAITCTKTNGTSFAAVATSGSASDLGTGTLPTARLSLGQITNSLGANVTLNNTANYFDGPSIAQGSTGTWWASGGVVVGDTGSSASILCKLWDGTTVIDSRMVNTPSASNTQSMVLSGFLASPAGNLRISCRDTTSTNGLIIFNGTGNSKDSTISAFRIN